MELGTQARILDHLGLVQAHVCIVQDVLGFCQSFPSEIELGAGGLEIGKRAGEIHTVPRR